MAENPNNFDVEIIEEGSPLNILDRSPSTAFFAGAFEKGEIDNPIIINSAKEFKYTFGRATKDNYNEWYQVYNYLQYRDNLYVGRSSGDERYNSQDAHFYYADDVPEFHPEITIENHFDFYEKYDSIVLEGLSPIKFIARTPGEWGNILQVISISKLEYNANVILYDDVTAWHVFDEFDDDEYGVLILRNMIIMETFIKTDDNMEEINEESKYVYCKNQREWTSGRVDGNLFFFDGNVMFLREDQIYDGEQLFDYKIKPIFYGEQTLQLSQGYTELPNEGNIQESYMLVSPTEEYDLDIIIGNERNNHACIELVESRKDCIGYIGTPNLKFSEIKAYRDTLGDSQFMSVISDYKRQFDYFSNKYIWVNLAADCAGLKASSDAVNGEWFTAAGMSRGQIKNIEGLRNNFNKQKNDRLFQWGINSISKVTGLYYLNSQKTMISKDSSFDRINIRSLFNKMEKDIAKLARLGTFEENTHHLRNILVTNIKPYLEDIKASRGIQAFKVICDESNNTEAIIQNRQLIIDIIIRPTYVAEYIRLRITNTGTNSISEVQSRSA